MLASLRAMGESYTEFLMADVERGESGRGRLNERVERDLDELGWVAPPSP